MAIKEKSKFWDREVIIGAIACVLGIFWAVDRYTAEPGQLKADYLDLKTRLSGYSVGACRNGDGAFGYSVVAIAKPDHGAWNIRLINGQEMTVNSTCAFSPLGRWKGRAELMAKQRELGCGSYGELCEEQHQDNP